MRTKRIKVDYADSVHHLISRTVAGERLLGRADQEVLRRQIHQMAGFCGIQVLTYCILSNHFHLLVRVPPRQEVADAELVRRYRLLYGSAEAKALEKNLASSERAGQIRESLTKRMHDISFFMKELKMRFTIYYNKNHNRFGTLWAERFKSLLVESKGRRNAVLAVAAYINLNPVRAGLCNDPKDYRFCGYGEAIGGGKASRAGLMWIVDRNTWRDAAREYRTVLFGAGVLSDRSKEGGFDSEKSRAALEAGGKLPRPELLRCRVRYFSDGLALGSKKFVSGIRRMVFGETARRPGKAPDLPVTDPQDLCFARRKRRTEKA